MQRLTIYLKQVDKSNNRIQNVVSYEFSTEKEKNFWLNQHSDNIKKHQITNLI